MFYDPQKKRIVDYGSSRPCGSNMNRFSIHAEQKAIEYCRKNDKRNRYQIYISRYSRTGSHKPTMCCSACNILVHKYNFENRIFTINENNDIISAINDNPEISLAYKIKYDMN